MPYKQGVVGSKPTSPTRQKEAVKKAASFTLTMGSRLEMFTGIITIKKDFRLHHSERTAGKV